MNPNEIQIKGESGQIAARVWQEGSPRKLLALHGWLDNAASFDRLAPRLDGYEVVALDFPGHGHSDWRPPGTFYYFTDWVAELAAVVRHLGWEQFVLMGHSMGGSAAALYAGCFPERVQHLILLEAMGPFHSEAAEAPSRLREAIEEAAKLEKKVLPVYPDADAAARAREKQGGLSHAEARLISTRNLKEVPGGVTWRSDPRLRLPSPWRLTEPQVRAYLSEIRAPTLVVRANQGISIPEEQAAARLGSLAHVTTCWVPGFHHAHLSHAELVAKAVLDFLPALSVDLRKKS